MKKTISAIMAAAMGLTSLGFTVNAYDNKTTSEDTIVVFGDSIASGYSKIEGQVEYNYGEICADYLGYEAINHAVPGAVTEDLSYLLESDYNALFDVADAEIIVISIGGNDIMTAAALSLLDTCDANGLLKDGYSLENLPEDASYDVMLDYIDKAKLKAFFASSSTSTLSSMITNLRKELRGTNNVPGGVIFNEVLPETESIIKEIRSWNYDGQIIVQNLYQPLQLSQEFIDTVFGEGSEYEGYASYIDLIKNLLLEDVVKKYNEGLAELQTTLASEGTEFDIADVYTDFTSIADGDSSSNGNANYFVEVENTSFDDMDIHPNQKGHLAIAAAVLDTTELLHDADSDALIRTIYEGLEDKAEYPEIALETYTRVVGNIETTEPPTEEPTEAPTDESKGLLGDANQDNAVDASDASLVLKDYALTSTGNASELNEAQFALSDVNGDNAVDASDASTILSYYAYKATGGEGTLEDFI